MQLRDFRIRNVPLLALRLCTVFLIIISVLIAPFEVITRQGSEFYGWLFVGMPGSIPFSLAFHVLLIEWVVIALAYLFFVDRTVERVAAARRLADEDARIVASREARKRGTPEAFNALTDDFIDEPRPPIPKR